MFLNPHQQRPGMPMHVSGHAMSPHVMPSHVMPQQFVQVYNEFGQLVQVPIQQVNGQQGMPQQFIQHNNNTPMYGGYMPNRQFIPDTQPQQNPQNRFGSSNQELGTPPGISNTQPIQQDIGNRYQQNKQEESITMKPISEFSVSSNGKIELNPNVSVSVLVDKVKDSQVTILDSVCLVDSLTEGIENVIEEAYSDGDSKLITAQRVVLSNTHYNCDLKGVVTELFSSGIKSLYKTIRSTKPNLKNIFEINLINTIDKALTVQVNDFLAVNVSVELTIDMFSSDFNDLLKYIRNNTEDMEDKLITYMDNYVNLYKDNLELVTENKPGTTITVNDYVVVYVKALKDQLGLNALPEYTVKLSHNPANNFIKSLVDVSVLSTNYKTINMVTIDKCIYEVIINANAEYYITQVA